MNSLALTVLLFTMISITVVTIYFFVRVLKTPPKPEPDSYSKNDDKPRV
jgi:hypothetical protein